MSDHCPVLLEAEVINWGPRPFEFLDVRLDHPKFTKFVESSWREISVENRQELAVGQKSKLLKAHLVRWNKEVYDFPKD